MQRGGDIAAAVRIRETGQPFFRYGETDWEFLKRMLGYGGLNLYHGTARRFSDSIREKGLLPAGRQYVHLSQDMETAYEVGRRRDKNPCILKIAAKQAWKDGIPFYYENEKVWLADMVPNTYIKVDER